jgi:hypothetical protein
VLLFLKRSLPVVVSPGGLIRRPLYMKMNRLLATLLAVLFLAAASRATAQYYAFGKNKVQYE